MKTSTITLCIAAVIIVILNTVLLKAEIIPVSNADGKKYLPVSVKSVNRSIEDGTLICWLDENKRGSMYVQKINASGIKVWDETGVIVNTDLGSSFTADADYPDIYSDNKGGAVIIYRKVFFASEEIYCSKISSDGIVSDPVNLSSNYGGYNFSPVSTMTFDNGIIVTWENFTSGDFDIHSQKIDLNCNKLWNSGKEIVVCRYEGDQRKPAVTCDYENNAVISWHDSRNMIRSEVSGFDIYANKIDKYGEYTDFSDTGKLVMRFPEIENDRQFVSGELADNNGPEKILKEGSFIHNSVLSDKNSVIISAEIMILDRDSYIYVFKINSSLDVLWEKVIDYSSFQTNPLIISDNNNGACIFWNDSRNDQNNIYGVRLNSSGNFVNCNPGGNLISNDYSQDETANTLSDRYNKNGINSINGKILIPYLEEESGNIYLSEFQFENTAGTRSNPSLITENSGSRFFSLTFQNEREVLVFMKKNVIYAYLNSSKMKTGSEKKDKPELSNFPNPFNPVTKIVYDLPAGGTVRVKIYDMTGRLVSAPVNENQDKGRNEFIFNAGNLASGIYYCKVESGGFSSVIKMILAK